MKAASAHLQRRIIAALALPARQRELLSLQWRDVDLKHRRVRLLAHKTKDGEERVLPVSDALAAVLELVKNDPEGKPHAPAAFVFGNAVGERISSVKTAWRAACRRAGITTCGSTTCVTKRRRGSWRRAGPCISTGDARALQLGRLRRM